MWGLDGDGYERDNGETAVAHTHVVAAISMNIEVSGVRVP